MECKRCRGGVETVLGWCENGVGVVCKRCRGGVETVSGWSEKKLSRVEWDSGNADTCGPPYERI